MKIITVTTGLLAENAYILVSKDLSASVVIDGGEKYEEIKRATAETRAPLKAMLLTHAHYDHSGVAAAFQKDGVPVYIGFGDAEKVKTGVGACPFKSRFTPFTPDGVLKDGDKLVFGDIVLTVIDTPGHTDGSVTFMSENALFTGDLLFRRSVGRTDFLSGDADALVSSIKKLYALNGDYTVYPGHGEKTALSEERLFNPYVKAE